jgi:hypothetical protein
MMLTPAFLSSSWPKERSSSEDDDVGPFGVLFGVFGFRHEAVGNVPLFLIFDVVPDFVAFLGDLPGDVADQSAEGVEEKLFLFHGALGSQVHRDGSGGAKIILNPVPGTLMAIG